MPIDVGSPCIDRGGGLGVTSTLVDKQNPANGSGIIDYIAIWAVSQITGLEVASFSEGVANTLITNGNVALANAAIGLNEYNAPGDFAAFNINAGEYIGIYGTAGNIEIDWVGGVGVWSKAGDHIPCIDQFFAFAAGRQMSVYGTGVSGWTAGKILGIAVGDVAKVNGILRGDIGKIIGI